MDHPTLHNGRDKRVPPGAEGRRGMLVMPAWRGTFIVPDEVKWIVKRQFADLTSRSLQGEIRRGTFIVPDEATWIIKRYSPDVTSESLRRIGANHDSLLANRAQGRNPSYKRDSDAFKNISGRLLLGALPAILAITSLVIEVD